MGNVVEALGLCSTCRHATGCVYLRHARHPVLRCEEYDGYPPPPRSAPSREAAPPGAPLNAGEHDPGKYRGLCSDCEERHGCMFAKPEGGVWHCEEYR